MKNKILTLRLDDEEIEYLIDLQNKYYEKTLSKTIKYLIKNHMRLERTRERQIEEIKELEFSNLKYKRFGKVLSEFVKDSIDPMPTGI